MRLNIVRVSPRYSRSYPVFIGSGILGELGELLASHTDLEPSRCLVAFQGPVASLASKASSSLEGFCRAVDEYRLPDGEEAKSLERVLELVRYMHDHNYSRSDIVVIVGGGAASDAAGMAAALYKRGIPYINIPTTLLSMVDAAIGGKVAVNYGGVKNVLGAFYQPSAVVEDVDTLSTLPWEEVLSGLGEIVKYAYTLNAKLHRMLREHGVNVAKKPSLLADAIVEGVKSKARIVELDEREEYGVREILNFGHTFGHALEAATGIRHGIAVAWGCVVEAWAGVKLGYTPERVARELEQLVESMGFPKPGLPSFERLEALMRRDKKVRGERIRGVFTLAPGRGAVIEVMLHEYLEAIRWGASRVWGDKREQH